MIAAHRFMLQAPIIYIC
jgi:cytidyltransferase-like protein